mgnify:CR=1 FL=1
MVSIAPTGEELEEDVVAIFDQCLAGFDEPAELAYRMGGNPCRMTVKAGEIV